jgi:predicted membrane-bound spermidine synthase
MSLLLCTIMFVSGAAALLFETLWFRQAGLAFGNSVWASSLVLASFMAGLAVGNGLVARFGGRIDRPVRFYALLELAIAVAGVSLVWVLPLLAGWLAPLWRPILEVPWILNPLRLFSAFLLLIVPATAMGATLPVLVKALRARDPNFGSVLGRLYGWNTLGAVVGAVAGEALLIEWFGIRGSAFAAAGLNSVAAVAAIAVARRFEHAVVARVDVEPEASAVRISPPARKLLGAAFLSGGILLALEVVWFRFLHLFVYDTSLSFALVLAVVLAGIGLGGAAAGSWLRRAPEAFRHAIPVALLAGALTAFAYRGFSVVIAPYDKQLIRDAADILWLSAALMFPVSLLSGVLFTVTGTALGRELTPETRAAGWLTLANTIGGGLGALLAGFWLLPGIGLERSVFLLALCYGGVAALLWRGLRRRDASAAWRVPGAAAAVAFALALALFPFGRMQSEFLRTVARRMGEPPAAVAGMREGRTGTVLYLRADLYGEPMAYRLVTGSFGMASTAVWARRYMKQFVYWPVAVHPGLENALLISFGIGNTAKALSDTRSLRRIDVVDISRDILEMSDLVFPDPQQHPLHDPRVRVHVEDGRFFLLTTNERYDLITSEPPPPKHSGIVNLYTREYFRLVYSRLAEGGVNTYWLPVHSLLPGDTQAIIRAYCEVFVDCSLWSGAGYNWMLAGSRNGGFHRNEAAFARQWSDPAVVPELRALGWEKPEQLGASFLLDAPRLRQATRDVLPLTDDFPKRLSDRVDFRTMAAQHEPWMDSEAARARFGRSDFIRRAWPEALRRRTLDYFAFQQMIDEARSVRGRGPIHRGERIRNIHTAITQGDLHSLPLWWLEIEENQLSAMDRHLARGGPEAAHSFRLGARALADRDFEGAARYFAGAGPEGGDAKLVWFLRLYALCMADRAAEAKDLARDRSSALRLDRGDREFLDWLAETFPSFQRGAPS